MIYAHSSEKLGSQIQLYLAYLVLNFSKKIQRTWSMNIYVKANEKQQTFYKRSNVFSMCKQYHK